MIANVRVCSVLVTESLNWRSFKELQKQNIKRNIRQEFPTKGLVTLVPRHVKQTLLSRHYFMTSVP